MSRIPHFVWASIMSLLLATSLTSVMAAKTPPPNPVPSSKKRGESLAVPERLNYALASLALSVGVGNCDSVADVSPLAGNFLRVALLGGAISPPLPMLYA